MFVNIGGVVNAMMKLFIQFELAPIAVPLARMDSGKISLMRTHDAGPQENTNPAIYSQTMTTADQPAATWAVQSCWHLATITPVMS